MTQCFSVGILSSVIGQCDVLSMSKWCWCQNLMMTMSYPAVSSKLPPPSSGLVWAVELTPLLTPHSPESAGPTPRRFPRTPLLLSSSAVYQKGTQQDNCICFIWYWFQVWAGKPKVRETVVFSSKCKSCRCFMIL